MFRFAQIHHGEDARYGDFRHAADLVAFIREFNRSGAHPDPRGFGIGVAGFPEGHPATPNRMLELEHLKANNVDTDASKTVVGPMLQIDGKSEMFVGSDQAVVAAANKNPLLKRAGRGAYAIPVTKA